MGDMSSEPSMEDILSSIKKIIAEDSGKPTLRPRPDARPSVSADHLVKDESAVAEEAMPEDVLELTELTPFEGEVAGAVETEIVSAAAATQSRTALDSLSRLVVKAEPAGTDSLEAMVRDMLRPMLKEWLDAKLPDIVQSVVEREVARISGRNA
jgi:uncharacterized protein